MSVSSKPAEGHVLFWITEEDGREFATCGAAEFRAAMRERDELRAEVENLKQAIEQTWRPEVSALRAEVKRLKALEAWYTEAIDALHADVARLRAALEHEKAERDLDIESGGQAVEQLQSSRLRDENDALRAALLLVKDWPTIAALTDERMATIQQTLARDS